jgi:hypothetical protein
MPVGGLRDKASAYVCSMQLNLNAPAEDFDQAAFTRAVERLLAIIPQSDDLRLEVTTDLRASVRAKHPNEDYAAKFEQSRDLAFVMGKTLNQDDGSTDIIVDARIFSPGARRGDAERTLEHEGLHIAVNQRGEKLSDIRDRYSDPASAFGITLEVAGAACEEFRVERVLWAADTSPRADSQLADFENTLRRFEIVVLEASGRYQQDLDAGRIFEKVGRAFNTVATATGYVAAEYDATGRTRLPQVSQDLSRRLLGTAWMDLLHTLVQLPPADTHADRPDLDAQAHLAAEHIEAWLGHIGFGWEDRDGGLFFKVMKAAQWDR